MQCKALKSNSFLKSGFFFHKNQHFYDFIRLDYMLLGQIANLAYLESHTPVSESSYVDWPN